MAVGAKSQLMWGFEEVSGVSTPGQKAGTMYGVRVANFELLPVPVWDTRRNLDPSGQQLRDDVVGFDLPFRFTANMSVDDLVRWRFHQQGYAAITNPAAGVYDWTMRNRLSSDTLTVDPSRISLEGDIDDGGYATLGLNAAVDQTEIKVAARKIHDITISGLASNSTNLRDPETVVGPATYTGTVYVRDNRIDSDAEDTTNDIKFKVTTAGALDGTGKIKFTKGATAYGSVEYPVVAGVWMDVILADGTYAGNPLSPVQVMFTLGTGALTAGGTPDEWKIRAKRPKGTATYPSRNPYKSARCIITVGGNNYDVEEFSIVHKTPKKPRLSTASMFPVGLLDDDARSFSIRLKRDYVDRYFRNKMLSGTPVSFVATLNGDLIATVSSVSYYERSVFTSANAQVKKGGTNVGGSKQLQEDVEIEPYWDGTNVELTEVHRCTLSTLK